VSKVTDHDLMLLADGELEAAGAAEIERAAGAGGAAKVAAVHEIGDLVRTHLELAADDADERLGGLWDLVERRLDQPADPATAEAAATGDDRSGLWTRFIRWVDSHRAHFLTGALSAGAVAAVAFMLREPRERIVVRDLPTGPTLTPVLQPTPPEVESLEVTDGTGTVFTITDEDGGETAVIWVTPDDVVEGI